jgi:transposase
LYKQKGLKVLADEPRSGRPLQIDGEQRAKITALACSDPPEGYARWSLRLLADKAVELEYIETISHTEVADILKKTS